MKKLRRNLTSGLYLFIFLMLIEILLIVLVQFFLEAIFEYLSIDHKWVSLFWASVKLLEVIFVLVLYHKILNKHEDPEFKIAWLIGLVALPLFVTFIYLVFSSKGLSKQERRVMELSRATYIPYLKMQQIAFKENEEKVGDGLGPLNYIKNTAGMGYHSHNRVEYYKNGETFFPKMIEALKEAKEFIFIEFYLPIRICSTF